MFATGSGVMDRCGGACGVSVKCTLGGDTMGKDGTVTLGTDGGVGG